MVAAVKEPAIPFKFVAGRVYPTPSALNLVKMDAIDGPHLEAFEVGSKTYQPLQEMERGTELTFIDERPGLDGQMYYAFRLKEPIGGTDIVLMQRNHVDARAKYRR